MTALFGTEYFGFIASAYGVVTVCLLALVGWTILTYRQRKAALKALEDAGLKRSSRVDG